MKDKELAEEWWNNWVVKDWNDLQKAKDLFIQAFLAGLKARLQWHDLRKDPNDLPEKMGLGSVEVYVQYDTKGVTDFACYRFDKNIWERSEDNEQAVGVIAWCEIPTFDKE